MHHASNLPEWVLTTTVPQGSRRLVLRATSAGQALRQGLDGMGPNEQVMGIRQALWDEIVPEQVPAILEQVRQEFDQRLGVRMLALIGPEQVEDSHDAGIWSQQLSFVVEVLQQAHALPQDVGAWHHEFDGTDVLRCDDVESGIQREVAMVWPESTPHHPDLLQVITQVVIEAANRLR